MILDSRIGRIADGFKGGNSIILELLTFKRQQENLKVTLDFIRFFPISWPNRPIFLIHSAILKTFILETANF